MAFHAAQGPTLGLPQMIQSRAQFGYRGVIVPLFATAVHLPRVQRRRPGAAGRGAQRRLRLERATSSRSSCAVGAALLAIYGHDWVHRIFRILLFISFPLMIDRDRSAILFGAAGGGKPTTSGSFIFVAFMAQFSAAAAYNITYAPYVSRLLALPAARDDEPLDHRLRLLRRVRLRDLADRARRLAGRLARRRPTASSACMTAGNNVIDGLGDLAAFFSAAALAATMGMNAYGGDADRADRGRLRAARSSPTRRARVVTILGLAVVWFVIAKSISAYARSRRVFTSLTLMLYLLVPWTATNLVDFFFVRRGHYAITDLFKPRRDLRRLGRGAA